MQEITKKMKQRKEEPVTQRLVLTRVAGLDSETCL